MSISLELPVTLKAIKVNLGFSDDIHKEHLNSWCSRSLPRTILLTDSDLIQWIVCTFSWIVNEKKGECMYVVYMNILSSITQKVEKITAYSV